MAILQSLMAIRTQKLFMEYKRGILLFFSTVGFLVYLGIGGLIFLSIESPQEDAQLKTISKIKSNFVAKNPTIPASEVDELFNELSAKGVKGLPSNLTKRWTYGNSVLFSATLLTTIGYGHLSPSTPFGKIVCIIYTTIGIPTALCVFAGYVHVLMTLSESFKLNLFRTLKYWKRPFAIRLIHFMTVMTFIVVGCFVIPSWIFYWLESSWTYLDAFYFCFISLTTVGLGDFVPGSVTLHPQVDLYRFGATVYILAGVTTMMFLMTVFADFVRNFNNGFHELEPLTDEKVPIIKTSHPHSYGSVEEINDENRNLLQQP